MTISKKKKKTITLHSLSWPWLSFFPLHIISSLSYLISYCQFPFSYLLLCVAFIQPVIILSLSLSLSIGVPSLLLFPLKNAPFTTPRPAVDAENYDASHQSKATPSIIHGVEEGDGVSMSLPSPTLSFCSSARHMHAPAPCCVPEIELLCSLCSGDEENTRKMKWRDC